MSKIAIPGAIIVAALLIAGAIYISNQSGGQAPTGPSAQDGDPSAVLPITDEDHILGSPEATITVVEYSDIDCPFCKRFHETMKRIIDEHGAEGEVAWVYRHFPLTQLHPNARQHAIAAECVSQIGGNQAFWDFLDILFAEAPGNEQTDPSRYGEFAAQVGVSEEALNTCLDDPAVASHVDAEQQQAFDAGATGTPFNVIVVEGQDPVPVSGALPYESMKGIVEQILSQTGA